MRRKIDIVLELLETHFPNPPIPLLHEDAYTLLIGVLLSAQCQDARVNLVTPKLFRLAKTPQEMVKIPLETIKEIIHPCGLSNTKAKAILSLSEKLITDYNGVVPNRLEDLETLSGVGHKTASVVLCQAFGLPAFPVDTHIHRCAKRWGLSSGKNVATTESDLKALIPKERWHKAHLQIIYFARAFCFAKKHLISNCPICNALTHLT